MRKPGEQNDKSLHDGFMVVLLVIVGLPVLAVSCHIS